MYKTSIIDRIMRAYVDENLESAKKINYTELGDSQRLVKIFYKDLPNTEIDGYPVASDYVAPDGTAYSVSQFMALSDSEKKACELRYYYLPNLHELYVGTTGSGKTTGCVEPQLRAISSQKNKPNLFLTDPKGELFDRNAKHLKDNGYEIFVLNFKDLMRSDKWNPLFELYDMKVKVKNIGKKCKMHTGKVKKGLELIAPEDRYNGEAYIEYDGKAFPDGDTCDNYIHFQKDILEANISSLIGQIVHMMIPPLSDKDKSWEFGAQDLLKGILQSMLADAVDENSGFTKDMMNFKTIQDYYLALKLPIFDESSDVTLDNHPLIQGKDPSIAALMATALRNAPNTMKSYCGVFDSAVKDWFQSHILSLTTGNTINLDSVGDKPFAIFLITRDYEKSDFLIAGLFIDWVYRQMIEGAEHHKNARALHFLLDEFGNIPEIRDLENKIATSRSRNIWFHLVVQSYAQIDNVYGQQKAIIIRDNCNSQIFLGAQNRNTKEIFSKECGRHSIPTLQAKIDSSDNSIVEVPLVPVSDLDLINPGEMYVNRLYTPVITSQFIRSYICAANGTYKGFNDSNGLLTCTPFRIEPFTGEKFTYKKLKAFASGKYNRFDF